MNRAQVSPTMVITPTPPSVPGVYLFLSPYDRIMYVGMAQSLQNVLYLYQSLEGRQKMRDRAAVGDIGAVVWFELSDSATRPSLEAVLIGKYEPPWNKQQNPFARPEDDAVPLTEAEIAWIEHAAASIDSVVSALTGDSNHPRTMEDLPIPTGGSVPRTAREGTCRALVLASMKDLEQKTGRTAFERDRIIKNTLRMSDAYPEETVATHVTAHMCIDAPNHQTADLRRVSRGVYERINRD